MMCRVQGAILAAAFLFALAAPAAAEKIVVTPNGPLTIQQAVDQAQPGDVIEIRKGRYVENVVIREKTGISIRGKGKPQLDGGDVQIALTIEDSSDVTVSGIVVPESGYACLLVVDCADLTVQKCSFSGGDVFGIRVESSQRVTISKCTVERSGNDGINLGGNEESGAIPAAPSNDCVVERTKVSGPFNDGIELAGGGHVVTRCTVEDVGEDALATDAEAAGDGNVFERNKVRRTGRNPILVGGGSCRIVKNKIQDFGGDGIRLRGTGGHIVEKNKIQDGNGDSSDGIDQEDGIGACTIVRNKVTNVSDDGIEVEFANGKIEKNSVKGAADNGFQVTSGATGNDFVKNKAKKSGTIGLDDRNPQGANDYEKNKFDGEQFDDV